MKASILTKSQFQTFTKKVNYDGIPDARFTVTICFDDRCNNGHNTFSIGGDIYKGRHCIICGCIHDEITEHFPELAKYIKWHLCSTDGPLYYLENSMYHAKEISENSENYWPPAKKANLKAARNCAVWPEAELEDFTEEKLLARLPKLMEEFRAAVEELGFIW